MAPGARGERGAVQLPMPSAWEVYFPEEPYLATDRRAMLIHQLLPFFATSEGWTLLSRIKKCGETFVLELDYEVLQAGSQSADLAAAIDVQPVEGLACISAAVYEAFFVKRSDQIEEVFGSKATPAWVKARLYNLKRSATVIRLLKASAIGKLVTIKGTVVRASHIKPLVTELDFSCGKCGTLSNVKFQDGVYQPPTACAGDGCRGRTFVPERSTAKSIDWKKLRIQELNNADKEDAGRIPRTIEVELHEDLVDCCAPGDVVTVLGLVKVVAADPRSSGKKDKCLFLVYLEAVSVVASRKASRANEDPDANASDRPLGDMTASSLVAFSLRDLQFISKFTEEFEGEQLRHLVHALCPPIFGHELIKAGLLLALFGGVRKFTGSKNQVPTRGDLHLLICGDPGLGKSQLLQAAAAVAPRGIYVCGNSSTSAGLTGTVVRDPVSGSYMCEAGALVLADRGVCCVDEFDKMSSEHQALLGAMEQQEVTISKAGVCATLPARTTVLAAANPTGGHYTRAKTISENLKLTPAMLSRFDVIFLLLDRPDGQLDERLSEHIMAIHSGGLDRENAAKRRLLEYRTSAPTALLTAGPGQGRLKLQDRLKRYTEDDADPMPPQLIRKYIAYARAYVHPVLSAEAKQVLKEFYLELRLKAAAVEGAPVTTRQLESLVRLAEARARVELRDQATKEDALDVVDLMRETLLDEFANAGGMLDCRTRGGGRSKQAEAARFLSALHRKAELQGSNEFAVSELFDLADNLELAIPDLSTFIEQLNEAGELLKRGAGRYSIRGGGGSQQRGRAPCFRPGHSLESGNTRLA